MYKKIIHTAAFILLLSLPGISRADSTITMNTFYPSPSGNYDQITMTPTGQPYACDPSKYGTLYVDSATKLLSYCTNETGVDLWKNVGGGPSAWTRNGSLIYPTDSTNGALKVGIHKVNPTQALEVQGIMQISGAGILKFADANHTIYNSGGMKIDIKNVANENITITNNAASRSIVYGIGGSERMRIDNNGNVGIGTSAPQAVLSVQPGIANTTPLLFSVYDPACGGGQAWSAISLNGSTSGCQNYNFRSSPGPTAADRSLYINRPNGYSIQIREANGAPKFTIATGGDVTIADKLILSESFAMAQGAADLKILTDSIGDGTASWVSNYAYYAP